MKNFSIKATRKIAYGVGKVIEFPYDFIKTWIGVADKMPELGGSNKKIDDYYIKELSFWGGAFKVISNVLLTPVQWLLGTLYSVTGLRALTNFFRESSDRLVLNHTYQKLNNNSEVQDVKEILAFLQQQRRKNNSGRGAFTYREGQLVFTEFDTQNDSVDLYGESAIDAGWAAWERRSAVDDCIDELLDGKGSFSTLERYLDARSKRTGKKLEVCVPCPSDQQCKGRTPGYQQHSTNLFFMKKTEKPENRSLRLHNNKASLDSMLAVVRKMKNN